MKHTMEWSLPKRVAFRFLFLYLSLYCFLFWVPMEALWGLVDISFRSNGSGDTIYHYFQVLGIFLAALIGAAVWSAADRKRPNYRHLYLGLRVAVRLFLAVELIHYGAMKVIPAQFPYLSLQRLTEPFGNASPMGLLWTFMGASPAYTIFAGSVEMLGGVLLFFPRTALLGALVSLVAMTQVCVLNFCYDVAVKLFSTHLLGMTVFLTAHDARRLASFLVWNQNAPPAVMETILQRPAMLRAVSVMRTVFLVVLLGTSLYSASSFRRMWAQSVPETDPSRFQLLNRGFHWVSDSPYNR